MNYRDDEYAPEMGDLVDVYSEEFEPESARVVAIGKSKIRITYDNDNIKPRSEWVLPSDRDMVSREQ